MTPQSTIACGRVKPPTSFATSFRHQIRHNAIIAIEPNLRDLGCFFDFQNIIIGIHLITCVGIGSGTGSL